MNASELPPPELDVCSRCHEHTNFENVEGEWLSVCCGARPVDVDHEPLDDR